MSSVPANSRPVSCAQPHPPHQQVGHQQRISGGVHQLQQLVDRAELGFLRPGPFGDGADPLQDRGPVRLRVPGGRLQVQGPAQQPQRFRGAARCLRGIGAAEGPAERVRQVSRPHVVVGESHGVPGIGDRQPLPSAGSARARTRRARPALPPAAGPPRGPRPAAGGRTSRCRPGPPPGHRPDRLAQRGRHVQVREQPGRDLPQEVRLLRPPGDGDQAGQLPCWLRQPEPGAGNRLAQLAGQARRQAPRVRGQVPASSVAR